MRHEKNRTPTYRSAVELSGVQFEIASGAHLKMRLGQIAYKQTDRTN
ncbi:hypothetical protein E2C01_062711 [Portunus trituberculatus]|uniref:Uncharacterized protein n=1 Tax=Portunus trituberculatus TaxID=210409 RepID=A0A5B7HFF9_PORTR|nr:hypothetical protein [Portunus trituberculatus]